MCTGNSLFNYECTKENNYDCGIDPYCLSCPNDTCNWCHRG